LDKIFIGLDYLFGLDLSTTDFQIKFVEIIYSKDFQQGSVFVYEIPCDFIHGRWTRHTLTDGTVDLPHTDVGSGGLITVFYPQSRSNQVSRLVTLIYY